MSIKINGNELRYMTLDGYDINSWIHNGIQVFKKIPEYFWFSDIHYGGTTETFEDDYVMNDDYTIYVTAMRNGNVLLQNDIGFEVYFKDNSLSNPQFKLQKMQSYGDPQLNPFYPPNPSRINNGHWMFQCKKGDVIKLKKNITNYGTIIAVGLKGYRPLNYGSNFRSYQTEQKDYIPLKVGEKLVYHYCGVYGYQPTIPNFDSTDNLTINELVSGTQSNNFNSLYLIENNSSEVGYLKTLNGRMYSSYCGASPMIFEKEKTRENTSFVGINSYNQWSTMTDYNFNDTYTFTENYNEVMLICYFNRDIITNSVDVKYNGLKVSLSRFVENIYTLKLQNVKIGDTITKDAYEILNYHPFYLGMYGIKQGTLDIKLTNINSSMSSRALSQMGIDVDSNVVDNKTHYLFLGNGYGQGFTIDNNEGIINKINISGSAQYGTIEGNILEVGECSNLTLKKIASYDEPMASSMAVIIAKDN